METSATEIGFRYPPPLLAALPRPWPRRATSSGRGAATDSPGFPLP